MLAAKFCHAGLSTLHQRPCCCGYCRLTDLLWRLWCQTSSCSGRVHLRCCSIMQHLEPSFGVGKPPDKQHQCCSPGMSVCVPPDCCTVLQCSGPIAPAPGPAAAPAPAPDHFPEASGTLHCAQSWHTDGQTLQGTNTFRHYLSTCHTLHLWCLHCCVQHLHAATAFPASVSLHKLEQVCTSD